MERDYCCRVGFCSLAKHNCRGLRPLWRVSRVAWRTKTENDIASHEKNEKSHGKKLEDGRFKAKKNPFFRQNRVQAQHSLPWRAAEGKGPQGPKKQLNKSINICSLDTEMSSVQKFLHRRTLGGCNPIGACGSRTSHFSWDQ